MALSDPDHDTQPDLLDTLAEHLTHAHIDPNTADRILTALRQHYGGDRHYIRRHDRPRRDQTIAQRLQNGEPPTQIAKRTGLSRATIYRKRSQWL